MGTEWLGSGMYFWENDTERAKQWVIDDLPRQRRKIRRPFILGAFIEIGRCLDLSRADDIAEVKRAHRSLSRLTKQQGAQMPENERGFRADFDRVKRNLDCAVINYLHELRKLSGEPPYDSVRSPLMEGRPAYRGAAFAARTHVQLCVRNHRQILGFFRVQGDKQSSLYVSSRLGLGLNMKGSSPIQITMDARPDVGEGKPDAGWSMRIESSFLQGETNTRSG